MGNEVLRVDAAAGIEERAGWFGGAAAPLFGYSHAPLDRPATAALVVCPPVLGDLAISYRREVVLARELAGAGVLVQRFQYRGMGNSLGDPAATTFPGLVEDACLAVELARSLAPPAAPLALLGSRVGALVAAAATRRFSGAALALWEPVVEGGAYFREARRAWMIRAMAERRDRGRPDGLAGELRERGWADVAGDELHLALYESTVERTLDGELAKGPRPVLVVQPGSAGDGALDGPLSQALAARGCRVEIARLGEAEAWWFNPTPEPVGVAEVAGRLSTWLAGAARQPA